jgi:hypothetical protein
VNALWVDAAGYVIIALMISFIPGRLNGQRQTGKPRTHPGADIRGQPIGAAVAGVLADRIGVPAALIVMILDAAASAAYAWSSALRHTDVAGLAQLRDDAEQV